MSEKIDYRILGDQVANDLIGAELAEAVGEGGLDAQFGINAASELLSRGVTTYQQKQAADAASADANAKLTKALAADVAWAEAEEMLDLASKSHDAARTQAAQLIRDAAQSSALGIVLPASVQGKRVEAAQNAVSAAASAAAKDTSKVSKLRAWQKVAAGIAAGGAAAAAGTGTSMVHAKSSQPSFFTREYAGAPMYVWLGGGAIVLTGVGLLIHSLVKKGR